MEPRITFSGGHNTVCYFDTAALSTPKKKKSETVSVSADHILFRSMVRILLHRGAGEGGRRKLGAGARRPQGGGRALAGLPAIRTRPAGRERGVLGHRRRAVRRSSGQLVSRKARNHHAAAAAARHAARVSTRRPAPGVPPRICAARHATRLSARHAPAAWPAASASGLSSAAGALVLGKKIGGRGWSRERTRRAGPRQKAGRVHRHASPAHAHTSAAAIGDAKEQSQKVQRERERAGGIEGGREERKKWRARGAHVRALS